MPSSKVLTFYRRTENEGSRRRQGYGGQERLNEDIFESKR
jgi:hypothetical protein